MAAYRFRVAFEDYDDVVRDIDIVSTQTFEDLHKAIQTIINFDGSKPASFYLSDDNWKKGKEFTNRELKESEKESVTVMSKARLRDCIIDPHQKIYYISDFSAMWAFRIELVKILVTEERGVTYPHLAKSIGEAPKQYGNIITGPIPQPDDFEGDVIESDMPEEETIMETEEVVEEGDVPLGVESENGVLSDLEETDESIEGEEGKLDNDEF